jgi:carbamoyl-phosphate synthase large subunit
MPRRDDIEKVLIIGSGPIVIGQACEFDYAGTQACRALRSEGYKVVLVNSNPATIMTDPEMAERTYIEPLTADVCEAIIVKERPDAMLSTLGGQTGLNIAFSLAQSGFLGEQNVELLGASLDVIRKAENRLEFKQAMERIRLSTPTSVLVTSVEQAEEKISGFGFPVIVRPSFTLGGIGSSIIESREEFRSKAGLALDASPVGSALIEEFLLGWREYELEVMRDRNDNAIVVCSIENFDPMGVHTGDSITVAPQQTLPDREYQRMRDAALAVVREIGVDTGGSNVQFAYNPRDGRMLVIEMNPRVSRSSALASKATGFPIAKIAAKLAVGYTLDEIPNDITGTTPASFEPSLDYCVVKLPRWANEKFPGADTTLNSQMKSVGETMGVGRTFKEAFQKAVASLEESKVADWWIAGNGRDRETIRRWLAIPNPRRCLFMRDALRIGMGIEEIHELSGVDSWFITRLAEIVDLENTLRGCASLTRELVKEAKSQGFVDREISHLRGLNEDDIRAWRQKYGILPTVKSVDTCAGEFEARTPYYYSTYETEDEFVRGNSEKVIIIGSGPNRIGQGIEFDYCCVQASLALREEGYESVMINSNPETVSTDYDISSRLYFEPLTLEHVLNVVEKERPVGVVVQFGGQTALGLAKGLSQARVRILGTSFDDTDRAENRKRFKRVITSLGLLQPRSAAPMNERSARNAVAEIGYPVIVRPSYVLGGRAMEIVYDEARLGEVVNEALSECPGTPVLIEEFLEGALEVDVDGLSDGSEAFVAAVMEHIEEAGIHSGDSSCVIPPYSLGGEITEEIRRQCKLLARRLNVKGLFNIQLAVRGNQIYVLEMNPRASRTVPFVAKAVGIPLARVAAKLLIGRKLKEFRLDEVEVPAHVTVKKPVFPFARFQGVDTILGPEMRSTGEVMGIDRTFGRAFAKAQLASDGKLPTGGRAFISVNDKDKRAVVSLAKRLAHLGFSLLATSGTARTLRMSGLEVEEIYKVNEGIPDIAQRIQKGDVTLVINTPLGRKSRFDEPAIRRSALRAGIPCVTTISGASALVTAIEEVRGDWLTVRSLQEYHSR